MVAPETIRCLVTRFEEHREAYRLSKYIDFSDSTDKARHDKMVSLVERMLELQKQSTIVHSPRDNERLVYELYGLTED